MAPRTKPPVDEQPLEPEECPHPGRPSVPRPDSKAWHCEICDTSFVPLETTEITWRAL